MILWYNKNTRRYYCEEKTYCGSFPRHVSDGRSVLQDRIILQEKLEESVAKEDFEKAAIYRDKIKELDKKDG